jgi:hypothetical protein
MTNRSEQITDDLTAGAPATLAPKAALYLRVSTGRQAESDLSIPDQRRQIGAHCVAKGWEVVSEFVEPGNTATDDRRPSFQAMIDAALTKPPTFTLIIVHSFSRFFRDQFQFEFYVRKLAKNGVRLISTRWCRRSRRRAPTSSRASKRCARREGVGGPPASLPCRLRPRPPACRPARDRHTCDLETGEQNVRIRPLSEYPTTPMPFAKLLQRNGP